MAYDFLGLVNDVNRRLNEVELTTATFPDAKGFYSLAKDAVNAAIRHIGQEEFEWPFMHIEDEIIVSPGSVRYGIPVTAKTVDFDSFRIKREPDSMTAVYTGKTQHLKIMQYEEWLDKHADTEYNSGNTEHRSMPTHVVRTPSREFILYPAPDKEYTVVFEYYNTAYEMMNAADIPEFPEQYRHIIVDGAMYYVHQFRGDMQAANMAGQHFEKGIKHLRSIHINRTQYIRDTRVYY